MNTLDEIKNLKLNELNNRVKNRLPENKVLPLYISDSIDGHVAGEAIYLNNKGEIFSNTDSNEGTRPLTFKNLQAHYHWFNLDHSPKQILNNTIKVMEEYLNQDTDEAKPSSSKVILFPDVTYKQQ